MAKDKYVRLQPDKIKAIYENKDNMYIGRLARKYGTTKQKASMILRGVTFSNLTKDLVRGKLNTDAGLIGEDIVKIIYENKDFKTMVALSREYDVPEHTVIAIFNGTLYARVTKPLVKGVVKTRRSKLSKETIINVYTSTLSLKETSEKYNVKYRTAAAIRGGAYPKITDELVIGRKPKVYKKRKESK